MPRISIHYTSLVFHVKGGRVLYVMNAASPPRASCHKTLNIVDHMMEVNCK